MTNTGPGERFTIIDSHGRTREELLDNLKDAMAEAIEMSYG